MKYIVMLVLLIALAAPAFATTTYSNDFESDALGTLPTGWSLSGSWGEFAPGPVTAEVVAGPTGGQAIKIVFGTDWASYGSSSGELDSPTFAPADGQNAAFRYEYDFRKENWAIWQQAGDQIYAAGSIAASDESTAAGQLTVGGQGPLTNVPEASWIHVINEFNSATDVWTTKVTYAGTEHTFTGISTEPVYGQFWFGGWAFQSTMDTGTGGYANAIYLDNFSMSITDAPTPSVPEPGSLAALLCGMVGLGGFATRRRR